MPTRALDRDRVRSLAPAGTRLVRPACDEDTQRVLRLLRAAIDETGWKHEAVAEVLGVDGHYFSKMLAGEKPWGLRHLAALPADIAAAFAARYAEQAGFIVVRPATRDQAARQFVAGLLGLVLSPLGEEEETHVHA
jgi:hypothetical protein